jgi:hypothetical protein
MPVSVTVLNPSFIALNVQVNNGPMFKIPAASPSNGVPQTSASGGPSWNGNYPGPNQLGPGQNVLVVTTMANPSPMMLHVSLPAHLQWTSLQLYIFIHSNQQTGWVALNNGTLVAGSIS